jgi:anti-sigma B factor antagonist
MAWVVVTPVGAVDVRTAAQLDEALVEAAERTTRTVPLLVDLRGVTFLASAGLKVLLASQRRCKELGTSMLLGAPPQAVTRVLQLTDLNTVFTVVPQLPFWSPLAAAR